MDDSTQQWSRKESEKAQDMKYLDSDEPEQVGEAQARLGSYLCFLRSFEALQLPDLDKRLNQSAVASSVRLDLGTN